MSTPTGDKRPTAQKPKFRNIPEELRALDQWVVWRYVNVVDTDANGERRIRWQKVPFQVQGAARASTTDPEGWASFEAAVAAYKASQQRKVKYDGIGFVFTADDPFVFIDIDDIDSLGKEDRSEVEEFVRSCQSYTEWSVSGEGLHTLAIGSVPGKGMKRGKFEFYDHARYVAITGDVEGDEFEIQECEASLRRLYDHVFSEPPKQRARPQSVIQIDDAALLDRARNAKNGELFSALYDRGDCSDYGGDKSAADMALATLLVWWTDHDLVRADELFRASALMREKWDERHSGDGRTYGEMTLGQADTVVGPGYQPALGAAGILPGLPVITVTGRPFHEVVDDCRGALLAANDPPRLFERGGRAVEIVESNDGWRVRPVTKPILMEFLSRSANLLSQRQRPVIVPPPDRVVAAVLERPEGLPTLIGVTDVPVVRRDGSVFFGEGYDSESGYFVTRDVSHLAPHQTPTAREIADAKDSLLGLLVDFPFVDDASRANALACLITGIVRPAIMGPTPMFVFDKPSPGSGASLLCEVTGMLVTGHVPGVTTLPASDEELDKRIFALLSEGRPVVVFDNVSMRVDHPSLAAALTSPLYQARRLGTSQSETVLNNALWLMTANNLSFGQDFGRRVVYIRIDPKLEEPHLRTGFKHPRLLHHLRENRDRYLTNIFVLVQAWHSRGRIPARSVPFGKYEDWSEMIGGILETAGIVGFMANREVVHDRVAVGREEWRAFLQALLEMHGVFPFTAGEICSELSSGVGSIKEVLPEELSFLLEGDPARHARKLGHALGAKRDAVFGDLRLVDAGMAVSNVRQYRIELTRSLELVA